MRRRRRVINLPPPPPEGFMWGIFPGDGFQLISEIERYSRSRMKVFDTRGNLHTSHYSDDPSYNWAEQVKLNKSSKG